MCVCVCVLRVPSISANGEAALLLAVNGQTCNPAADSLSHVLTCQVREPIKINVYRQRCRKVTKIRHQMKDAGSSRDFDVKPAVTEKPDVLM